MLAPFDFLHKACFQGLSKLSAHLIMPIVQSMWAWLLVCRDTKTSKRFQNSFAYLPPKCFVIPIGLLMWCIILSRHLSPSSYCQYLSQNMHWWESLTKPALRARSARKSWTIQILLNSTNKEASPEILDDLNHAKIQRVSRRYRVTLFPVCWERQKKQSLGPMITSQLERVV